MPEGFYLKSVRSANLDLLADGLEVAAGSPAPLDVVVSSKAGQVSGTVLDPRTQKAAAGMTVVLVPRKGIGAIASRSIAAPLRMRPAGSRSEPDAGRVSRLSWEEAEFGAWMDPDFMKPQEGRGEAVNIQEGARQAVQVNLIPADSQ